MVVENKLVETEEIIVPSFVSIHSQFFNSPIITITGLYRECHWGSKVGPFENTVNALNISFENNDKKNVRRDLRLHQKCI